MKRVVLVRHAKAVGYGYDDDFNRELRESGLIDARNVSNELKNRNIIPDKIISSPAVRALQTARIFAQNLGYEERNIRKVQDIYEGLTTAEFIEIIKKLPDELKTVFFFGHNPDFEYFAQNLLSKFNDELPTCATIGIEFDVEKWEKVESRTGIQSFILVPKKLK